MTTMDEISKGLSASGAGALSRVASRGGKDAFYAQSRLQARSAGKQEVTRGMGRNKGAMKRSLLNQRKPSGSLRKV